MTAPTPIAAHLDRLAALEPTGLPFVSLYLNTQPDQRGRDNFRVFLKRELNGRARTYAAQTPARRSLERDIERIQAYLEAELQPAANGVAVFACAGAGEFFDALQLAAPIDEHLLVISDRPHLYPLARLDARYPRAAAVVADTNAARILVFASAALEERRALQNVKTRRHDMGGWSQARYQRHVEHFHLHHAKEVVQALDRIVRAEGIEHVILFGDAVIVPLLTEQMPPALKAKVIGVERLGIDAPEKAILEHTLDALRRHDAQTDREKVAALVEAYRGGGLAVAGLEATRRALERGQVEELVLSASPAGLRPDTGDGWEPIDAARAADELIARARQTGARITFVEDPALVAPIGGVGAFLRYRLLPGDVAEAAQEEPTGAR
jgi:peptide chain release factor subunit 1